MEIPIDANHYPFNTNPKLRQSSSTDSRGLIAKTDSENYKHERIDFEFYRNLHLSVNIAQPRFKSKSLDPNESKN